MRKKETNAWKWYTRLKNKETKNEFWIAFLLAILAIVSVVIALYPVQLDSEEKTKSIFAYVVLFLSVAIGVGLFFLFVKKFNFLSNLEINEIEYKRQKKINEIHNAVFDGISGVNATKIRETLRYTYGSVPEWNPINYRTNVFLYDVHEQIRDILTSIKQIVINIDSTRFNDDNVSVELIYCYPSPLNDNGKLPLQQSSGNRDDQDNGNWRLISTGDTSGNSSKVVDYLRTYNSFYTLLEYSGTRFLNNKYEKLVQAEIEKIKMICQGEEEIQFLSNGVCFIPDIKDIEQSEGEKIKGSAVGTIINVRNDDPEDTFVKAILTINTYGECIYEAEAEPYKKKPQQRRVPTEADTQDAMNPNEIADKEEPGTDKFGLSEMDYKEVFCDNIFGTYKTLIASELAQVYIRHSIQKGKICPYTGRDTNKEDRPYTLPVAIDCSNCPTSECKRRCLICK